MLIKQAVVAPHAAAVAAQLLAQQRNVNGADVGPVADAPELILVPMRGTRKGIA